MYIITVYDISTETEGGPKRLRHIRQHCRQYLHHTQLSVFEGEITEAQLQIFRKGIQDIIKKEVDYVVIYKVENKNNLERENIGIDFNPQDEII